MRTIYKYQLEITDFQDISMPECSHIIHVAEQDGKLCLWALVDNEVNSMKRRIQIVGTGNPMPYDARVVRHIGSVIMSPFVWHVFESTVPKKTIGMVSIEDSELKG